MKKTRLRHLVDVALVLSFLVVTLGAYTRLTHAGLGCPDWPGCYGHLVLPAQSAEVLSTTQAKYGVESIEPRKAWTEMVHRYAAGVLALLIFLIGFQTLRACRTLGTRESAATVNNALNNASSALWVASPRVRGKGNQQGDDLGVSWFFPLFLMGLVVFQAALGMWTVTLKLYPLVVMAHLLGGILIFSSLLCLRGQLSGWFTGVLAPWRFALGLAVLIVFLQIALGGWVSSNYAGIACVGFPRCNGMWLPTLHWAQAFQLFSPLGENYQGGLLESPVRMTIQYVHRIGAVVTASYLIILGFLLLKKVPVPAVRRVALLILLLSLLQFSVGVINVMYQLPLMAAVAHNGLAALLMASVLFLFGLSGFKTRKDKRLKEF